MIVLKERRVSLTAIAGDIGKDVPTVSRVVRGERRSRDIELAIAAALGLPLDQAFPEWWRRGRPSAAGGTAAVRQAR